MRWLLRFSGNARRRFSRLPHWFHDVYGLASYINFIELIPTVASIAISPRHFFRRLPATLNGRRPLYQTPVKFFFNFAALFMAAFYMRHGDMSQVVQQSEALWLLPAMIPVTPLLMVGLGIVTWLLYQIPRIAPNGDAFPPPNHGPFKLLLNPRTYVSLDWQRYLWGLFYISVYFLAAWQIVQVLLAANFVGVVYLVGTLGDGNQIVKAIAILMGIAFAAFSIHGLVLHPYMELLRASLRHPTKSVFETDVHEIDQCIKEFLSHPIDDPLINAHAEGLFEVMLLETAQLTQIMSQQETDYDLSSVDIDLRLQIHRTAFHVEKLRSHLENVSKDVKGPFEKLLSRIDPPREPVLVRAA